MLHDAALSPGAAAWRRLEIGIALREDLLHAASDDGAALAACSRATWHFADVYARTGAMPVQALQRAAAEVEAIAVPLALGSRPRLAPLFADGD